MNKIECANDQIATAIALAAQTLPRRGWKLSWVLSDPEA